MIGTVCDDKNQYGKFTTINEARAACLTDVDCVGFLAIQTNCKKNVESKDFKLCKRNSKFTSNIPTFREYRQAARDEDKECFFDAFVKVNESGTNLK